MASEPSEGFGQDLMVDVDSLGQDMALQSSNPRTRMLQYIISMLTSRPNGVFASASLLSLQLQGTLEMSNPATIR